MVPVTLSVDFELRHDLKNKMDMFSLAKLDYSLFGSINQWESIDEALESIKGFEQKPCSSLFLYDGSSIVGYAFLTSNQSAMIAFEFKTGSAIDKELYLPKDSLSVCRIGVNKDYRRLGIGSLMLDGIVRDARNEGFDAITAICMGGVGSASYGLFSSRGFELVSNRRNYFEDIRSDAAFVIRYL